jgi:hypothetical protein
MQRVEPHPNGHALKFQSQIALPRVDTRSNAMKVLHCSRLLQTIGKIEVCGLQWNKSLWKCSTDGNHSSYHRVIKQAEDRIPIK